MSMLKMCYNCNLYQPYNYTHLTHYKHWVTVCGGVEGGGPDAASTEGCEGGRTGGEVRVHHLPSRSEDAHTAGGQLPCT